MKGRLTALSVACLLQLNLHWAAAAEMVSIAGDDINMRSAPGTDQPVLWQLGSGFPLEVITQKGDWFQVKDFEGSSGWVHRKTTQQTPYVIVRANKGTDQQINVRKEPRTDAEIVAKANYGVVFRVLATQGTWIKVEHTQGVSGWVLGSLLWGK
ncbi:MAG: SH3 domain-containing protein [Desulfobulbus sp.]|nr:SH3 domain-containing protein [Desulfobulbus sp.]